MKVLISGATGMVGSELGKALVRKGHQVFVLTRSKEKAHKHCPFPQTPITWDELTSHPSVSSLDAIVHLAGTNLFERRWNKAFKDKIYSSRVDTGKQLVALANQNKNIKSFVSTSGIGIYGAADDAPVDEEYGKAYSFLGKVCQDWEAPLQNLTAARGVVFRVGIVMSEKGGALDEMVPPIQAGFGGPLGSGQQFMSWIDIDDLVNLYIFALENPIRGAFNATAPHPARNSEITKTIADHLGVWAPFKVPYIALRLVLGEVAPHLVESQTISSKKIQEQGFRFEYENIQSSLKKRVPLLKGHEKRFIFEQWIPKPKDEVFEFFCEAKNLETITPASLNFRILDSSTDKIQSGTLINYKLKIDGIPVHWQTLIKDWNPPHMFSDNQEKGPYKKWYHTHRFEEMGGGTLMTDQVDFVIPMGSLGYLAAGWKVLRDVRNIFKYRREVIHKLYNNK